MKAASALYGPVSCVVSPLGAGPGPVRGAGVVPAKGLSWPPVVRLLVRVSPLCAPRSVHAPSCAGWRGVRPGVRSSGSPMCVTSRCLAFPVSGFKEVFRVPCWSSCVPLVWGQPVTPSPGIRYGDFGALRIQFKPYSPPGSLWQVLVLEWLRPQFASCGVVDGVTAGAAAPSCMLLFPPSGNVCGPCVSYRVTRRWVTVGLANVLFAVCVPLLARFANVRIAT